MPGDMFIDLDQPILCHHDVTGKTTLTEEMRRDPPAVTERRKGLGTVQPANTKVVLEPRVTVRRLLAVAVLAVAAAGVADNDVISGGDFGDMGAYP